MPKRRKSRGLDLYVQLEELEDNVEQNERAAARARRMTAGSPRVATSGDITASKSSFKMVPPPIRNPDHEGDFLDWIRKIESIQVNVMSAGYAAQVSAAEAIANILRFYLASGGNGDFPELSPLTIAINEGKSKPALATLANHVRVFKPKPARKDAGPGRPGVFSGEYEPAVIAFEDEEWDQKAFRLDQGGVFTVSAKRRQALFRRAKALSGWGQIGDLTSVKHPEGAEIQWWLPARPFAHILESSESEAIVREIAEAIFSDNPATVEDVVEDVKAETDWEALLEAEGMGADSGARVNFDDIQDYLADEAGTEDWMATQIDDKWSDDTWGNKY